MVLLVIQPYPHRCQGSIRISFFNATQLVREAGDGQEQLIKHTAKTYQSTGVAFVVKPFANWILAKLIGDKVRAVNARFDPFIMPKNKFDLL